jgi:acyl-CoA synthetase (AMP-forming)/AMP-acid ligase II
MYHKVPRQVVIVGTLPLTGPGKVDRVALRDMLRQAGIDPEDEPA